MSETKPVIKHRYTHNHINSSYIFRNGKVAHFFGGEFFTDVPAEIAELDAEVAAGHPNIGIDADKKTVDVSDLDPVAVIKKKAIEEYLAAQAKASGDKSRDMGNTEKEKLNVANSNTIAAAAAGSDSGAVAPAPVAGNTVVGNAAASAPNAAKTIDLSHLKK
jgi:hypothetical protein